MGCAPSAPQKRRQKPNNNTKKVAKCKKGADDRSTRSLNLAVHSQSLSINDGGPDAARNLMNGIRRGIHGDAKGAVGASDARPAATNPLSAPVATGAAADDAAPPVTDEGDAVATRADVEPLPALACANGTAETTDAPDGDDCHGDARSRSEVDDHDDDDGDQTPDDDLGRRLWGRLRGEGTNPLSPPSWWA